MFKWIFLTTILFSATLFASEEPSPEELVQREANAENALAERMDIVGPWDQSLIEMFGSLADAKLAVGKVEDAIYLYEQAIAVVRINYGLNHIDQMPYITKLVDLHFTGGEIVEADDRLDLAKLIITRFYDKPEQIPLRISGYQDLIRHRFGEEMLTHECFELSDDRLEFASHRFGCTEFRTDSFEHLAKAVTLQDDIVTLIEDNPLLVQSEDYYIQNLHLLRAMADFVAGVSLRLDLPGDLNAVDAFERGVQKWSNRSQKYHPQTYLMIITRTERILEDLGVDLAALEAETPETPEN